ncbi:TPR repeat protein [Constrictibacter sp. MBR-5]|uniref:tetratricopeptide repeat protein n=1 Tax=Constrictibacter sp. MBR-5 TaxID=3156467 RepID=UPI003391A87A
MTTRIRIAPHVRMAGASCLLVLGAATASYASTAVEAQDIPVLRPAQADYAKICVPPTRLAIPTAVDWSRWTPDSKGASPAEALAFARETLSARATDDDNDIARRVLESLVKSVPAERAAALYELAAADLAGTNTATEQTVKRLRRALALGYRRAAMLLGPIYENGLAGQAVDLAQAELFYKLAVQARLEGGALKLAALATQKRRPEEARQWIALAQQMMGARLGAGDCSQLSAMATLYLDGKLLPRSPTIAAEWLEAARVAGDARASRLLGELLLSGDGVPQDIARGLALLEAAADGGDLASIVALGRWYRGDYGATPDPQRARALFERAAAAVPPDTTALMELARAYRDGLGGAPDAAAAERTFARAADLGSVAAIRELAGLAFNSDPPQVERALGLLRKAAAARDLAAAAMLGRWLLSHSFTPDALAEGVDWLGKAAAQGHVGSAKALARHHAARLDMAAAARYWQMAADMEDPEALVELAALRFRGAVPATGDGPERLMQRALAASETQPWGFVAVGRALRSGWLGQPDAAAGFAMFRRAADRDDPSGLRETGEALAVGDGTERDAAEGWRLLEKASNMGDAGARIALARGLAAGWFGDPDPEGARERLEAAATAGVPGAFGELGSLYSRGAFGDVDPAAAVEWWRKAAMAGDAEAMRELANAHAIGFGADIDPRESVAWLERAAGRGDPDAMRRLAYAYHAGVGVEPDKAKAEHWTTMARFSAPLPTVEEPVAQ